MINLNNSKKLKELERKIKGILKKVFDRTETKK